MATLISLAEGRSRVIAHDRRAPAPIDRKRIDAELIAEGQKAHRIEEIYHREDERSERLSVATENERRPALGFIWAFAHQASPKVAIATICHVMEGARSDYEREKNGIAFLDAVNRCNDVPYALSAANKIIHDLDGYETYGVIALTTLAPKITDPFERELHLRSAALNGPANVDPAHDIAVAWEKSIQEIRLVNPEDANHCAAKAYAQAKGDSMIARVADRNSTTDFMRRYEERSYGSLGSMSYPPKRQRHEGPVQALKAENGSPVDGPAAAKLTT